MKHTGRIKLRARKEALKKFIKGKNEDSNDFQTGFNMGWDAHKKHINDNEIKEKMECSICKGKLSKFEEKVCKGMNKPYCVICYDQRPIDLRHIT